MDRAHTSQCASSQEGMGTLPCTVNLCLPHPPQTAPPTLPAPPTSTCPTHSACPAHSACPTHLCLPCPFCSQGEALVMEPLRLQWDMPDHPVAKHHLVAIGTVDKVHHATNTTCAAPPTVLDLLHAPPPHR